MPETYSKSFERLRRAYLTVAIIIANVVVLLLLVNAVSWLILPREAPVDEAAEYRKRAIHKYGLFPYLDNDIYGGKMNKDDIVQFFQDESRLDIQYEPFSMFTERKGYASKFINVSAGGYRTRRGQEPLSTTKKKKIFVFGGSTTFGYGVADEDTIPSYLHDLVYKDYEVYNFGRAYYYSRQEIVLFLRLLMEGQIPDIVIFIDGVNERPVTTGPSVTKAYFRIFPQKRLSLTDLPALRLASKAAARLKWRSASAQPETDWTREFVDAKTPEAGAVATEVDAYFREAAYLKKICGTFGIKPFVFYQPLPLYEYDYKRYHPFYKGVENSKGERVPVYREVDRRIKEGRGDVISLTNLSRDEKRPLYVDGVHYNPYFNKKIAQRIHDIVFAKR